MPGVGQDYHIDAKRFLESHDEFYEWPLHMAEKTWVNIEEFNAAFRQALAAHAGKYKGELDNAKLEASFRQAVRLKANP